MRKAGRRQRMHHHRMWIAIMLAAVSLSGCSQDNPGPADGTNPTATAPSTSGPENETALPDPNGTVAHAVNLTASVTEGMAPLQVTFGLAATGTDNDTTYRFARGDGTDESGSGQDLPHNVTHTYEVGGVFVALLEVTFGNATLAANVTITVSAEDVREPPPVTHFEYGRSAGCFWDLATIGGGPATPCITQQAGPSAPNVDGFWQAFDERYWGYAFTSTVDHGDGACSSGDDWPLCDSDCFFYAASTAFGDEIGNGHNGGGACAGVIPEGAAWLFITPYGGPSVGMELDITV